MSGKRKVHAGLPPYVYPRWNNLYLYTYDPLTRRTINPVKLCAATAPISEVWRSWEAHQQQSVLTLERLAFRFESSAQWDGLAASTRRDYLLCRNTVCARSVNRGHGRLGDVVADRITPGIVRQYIDKRTLEAPSRARHEGRWIKLTLSWAYERDLVARNAGRGVKIHAEPRRQRYVTDAEFATFKSAAVPWLSAWAHIAYACRLRACEVLDLTDADLSPGVLYCRRRKGSDDSSVALVGDLAAAVTEAQSIRAALFERHRLPVPIDPGARHLFVNRSGRKMSYNTVAGAWKHVMTDWPRSARWTPHDLKRKGISDTHGDKRKAAGHRSAQMSANYDVKREIVQPAGEHLASHLARGAAKDSNE